MIGKKENNMEMEEKIRKDLDMWRSLLAKAKTVEGEQLALNAIQNLETQLSELNKED